MIKLLCTNCEDNLAISRIQVFGEEIQIYADCHGCASEVEVEGLIAELKESDNQIEDVKLKLTQAEEKIRQILALVAK